MIASAQRSGHRVFVSGVGTSPAEALLRHLAEAIDRKRRRRISYVFSLLNNTLTLGFGALVLCICVAWFLPLVKLIGDLS